MDTPIEKKGGTVTGPSHASGGVKFDVDGKIVEAEGNEPVIPVEIYNDGKKYSFRGTNISVLKQIQKYIGSKSLSKSATVLEKGDVVICKISAADKTRRAYTGTMPQIVSKINQSCGCNPVAESKADLQAIGNLPVLGKGGNAPGESKTTFPANWELVEDDEDYIVFIDKTKTFEITIEITENLEYPYGISFRQAKGMHTLIGIESGAYTTHSKTREDSIERAAKMAHFINSKNVFIETMAFGGNVQSNGKPVSGYIDLSTIQSGMFNDITLFENEPVQTKPAPSKIQEIDIVKLGVKNHDGDAKITSSSSAAAIFYEVWNKNQLSTVENVYCLFLDRSNKVMSYHNLSKGGTSSSIIDPEIVAAIAVKSLAKGVIIAHNHPSGAMKASQADINMTQRLRQALNLFDIALMDSMILSYDGYSFYSMAEEGLMAQGGNVPGEDSPILAELNKAKSDLHKAENFQDIMKKSNAAIRSGKDVTNKLIEIGLKPDQAEKIQQKDFAGRIGFAQYMLTNNNASIKRLRDRVNMLEEKWKGVRSEKEEKYVFVGGNIEVNYDLDRVQIFFGGKPDENVRKKLKGNGWHWSPSNSAWQRKITPQAISNARFMFDAHHETSITEGDVPQDVQKTFTLSDIENRNFSFVTVSAYDAITIPEEFHDKSHALTARLVVFDITKATVTDIVKKYLSENLPELNIEKISIHIYPKTYVKEARALFQAGAYLPSNNPPSEVLIPLYNFVKKISPEKELAKNSNPSSDVFTAKEGRVFKNAEVIGSYEFDRDSDAFWVNRDEAGQLSFETKDEMIEHFRNAIMQQKMFSGEGITITVANAEPTVTAQDLFIDAVKNGMQMVEMKLFKGTDATYKNQYELNKAIEELIGANGDDPAKYSSDEKIFIKKYSGYGGLDKFGPTGKGGLFEYYTPRDVIEKMWALAFKYGYDNGSVCETSVGTGEFLQFAKPDTRIVGFEISEYSAKICKILYPHAEIINEPFERHFIDRNFSIKDHTDELEKFDLVIGNPPYGDFSIVESRYMSGMGEKDYTQARNYVEYFLRRGIDLLKSGGLLVFIIGAQLKNGGTMFLDSGSSPVKEYLSRNTELLDAYRLPDTIFERTGVTSDIIVLKKL